VQIPVGFPHHKTASETGSLSPLPAEEGNILA